MGPVLGTRFRKSAVAAPVLVMLLCMFSLAGADECKRVQNILVLFDASGNMKQHNNYDVFIKAMKQFEAAIPLTADGFFNVGLRYYGLKVGLGCESTESILAIQSWDPERFMNSFPATLSYGTSALSAGLRAAAEDCSAAEGKSIIILIGTGGESCRSDPIKIADRIAFNNPELEIHAFQIGDDQEGAFNLKGIARKCRGSYTPIGRNLPPAFWHAWMRRNLVMPCARQEAPQAPAASLEVGPVYFDSGSFSVRSKDQRVDASNRANLDAVGRHLQGNPAARLILHGFADGKGSQAHNQQISKRRAAAVQRYLAEKYGIPQARMGVVGHGVAPDLAPEGRVAHVSGRRVEFEFVQ